MNVRTHRKLLRNHLTEAETILWERLRKRQLLDTRFRRQVSIGNYITDFFTFDVCLAVEVDGKNHDNKLVKEYDNERNSVIENQDITIIRFKNEEVINHTDKVIEKIKQIILSLKRTQS
jgi:very-short-patch-repair endonuclease